MPSGVGSAQPACEPHGRGWVLYSSGVTSKAASAARAIAVDCFWHEVGIALFECFHISFDSEFVACGCGQGHRKCLWLLLTTGGGGRCWCFWKLGTKQCINSGRGVVGLSGLLLA
jgi:hypothetical protein